jgi:hypothetical protein
VQDELDAVIAQRRKLERERFDAQTVVRQTGEALRQLTADELSLRMALGATGRRVQ